MSGPVYVPRHGLPNAPTGRRAWPLVLLAGSLLSVGLGAAAVRAIGPGLPDAADVGLSASAAEPINVCMRASIEDRAGLVLVLGLPGVTAADDPLVDRMVAAGVGGVMLRDDNIVDEEQAQDLVTGLRARLGAHLLVAVDDEGGRVTSMGALGQTVTSARTLGRRGPDAAREAGRELGELAATLDIDWVFAPVVDLDDGPAGGVIGDRSFGADPEEVAGTAGAFVSGLHAAGVAVTVKHFPGHGGTGDPHLAATTDDSSLADLAAEDLIPFRALLAGGAEAAMVGHVAYPRLWGDLPASLEPRAYELLRSEGFDGVAVTDALGMGAVHARFGFDLAPAMAVAAGADAVLVAQGDQVTSLHEGLVAAVRDGRLDEARLDEAVRRLLDLRGQTADGTVCPA